ncbi:peptidase S55 SpoIVB [Thermodesulfobium narugense DSM 14796]|uniref:Peptidase S55 SpoIVB n=1 Tax=Thermodesulfobium narugense DSM 14796 TaxID=747365 RepID=M1E7H7_9BACT|nr:SpoIVB peptidase S55 domain-containing protein [Thermodesulfobium narugense]AEE15276.1 peptidase S55 SpoIVB [Thermodesulfobium narugense DSM 14796]
MKRLIGFLIAIFLLTGSCANAANTVQVGDVGVAKTTIMGSEISTFNVEIIGIVNNPGLYPSYLIKVWGKAIDFTGGIAEGMSGSPVYINGKLIGAISATFQNADPHIGLVTPIEAMRTLWNYEEKSPEISKLERPITIDNKVYTAVSSVPTKEDGVLVERPCVLYYEKGFSGRVLSMLKKEMPLVSDVSSETSHEWTAQPGASIAVQFARGSVELGAVGTLTEIDGNKILAFGHPATDAGSVDYFLSSAYTYYTIKSQVLPFKVASIISPIGKVVQDRTYGIAAYLGALPPTTTIDVNVNSNGEHSFFVQLPESEDMLLKYASKVVLQCLDDSLLSQHGGSSTVDITLRLSDGTNIERKNIYSDPDDISYKSVLELDEILYKLLTNPLRRAVPEYIGFKINMSNKIKSAQIDKINMENFVKKSRPIKFDVSLRPYREELYKEQISIDPNLPKGSYTMILTGSDESTSQRAKTSENASNKPKEEVIETFDELVKSITDKPKNNQMVIEIYSSQATLNQDKPEPIFKKYVDFPWVVTGIATKTFEVR